MKYRIEKNDLSQALGLDKSQEKRLNDAIQKAFNSVSNEDTNIDKINGFIAPYIKTPEEAFFVATTIISSVLGAMTHLGVGFNEQ